MSIPSDPLQWRIGLVGYGEVGRILAEDLRARGLARIGAYDPKLAGDAGDALRTHATNHGVALASSHADLAAGADFIVSASPRPPGCAAA